MIVIDVGCASFEGARSIPELIVRFNPDVIYGFDPNRDEVAIRTSVRVERSYAAAWTYDGTVGFYQDSTTSRVSDFPSKQVPCIDLARFIGELPEDEIVLRLDCEGAEHRLLEHLHETGADERLSLVLVEWHLRCPVEEWPA